MNIYLCSFLLCLFFSLYTDYNPNQWGYLVTIVLAHCTAPNLEPSVIPIKKRPYLSQMADNQKIRGTLLSRTLKVGEKNVPSEFRFVAYWLRYGRF